MAIKKVMVMPGHSVWDSGAVHPVLKVTEFDIVRKVALKIFCMDDDPSFDIVLKSRNKSYSEHPGEVNGWNPDYIVELHLNAAGDPKAQGSEVLYWGTSKRSQKMAEIVQKHLVSTLGYRDRGIKPLNTQSRGGKLARETKAPCVIVEGYFLSGIQSLEELKIEEYAKAVRAAIGEICQKNI